MAPESVLLTLLAQLQEACQALLSRAGRQSARYIQLKKERAKLATKPNKSKKKAKGSGQEKKLAALRVGLQALLEESTEVPAAHCTAC